MSRALPIFLLAGGEIFLAAVALRIAVWVVRGWRDWRALDGPGEGDGPPGPGGGLRVVHGGGGAEPPTWRAAA